MQTMTFKGNGFEYFKIWIVNILLTIITLTLYHPWAKVRNNRYFYANTHLDGHNFEYHATGKQLFFGYLIAMGLLLTYVLVSQLFPVAGLFVVLIFIFGFPWIIWRSLMFNMRVSSFSNVHFSFHGNAGGAYFNYLLMPVLLFLAAYSGPLVAAILGMGMGESSGMLLPLLGALMFFAGLALAVYIYGVMKKRNSQYVIDNTRYGQGEFATELKAGPFAKILMKTILLFLGLMIGYGIIIWLGAAPLGMGEQIATLFDEMENSDSVDPNTLGGAFFALFALLYLGFLIITIIAFAYSQTRQREYVYSNTMLDSKIRLASTLQTRPLAWISVTNLLLIVGTLGLAIPWAKVRLARYYIENTQIDTSVGLQEYTTQQLDEQSSLGDQIGDAFDVNVDIGL